MALPDDIAESCPEWLHLVVKVMFLAEFYDIRLSFHKVVTRHGWKETEEDEGKRERGRERGREREREVE